MNIHQNSRAPEQSSNQPGRVRVPGRDDIGEVIDGGKNFGTNRVFIVWVFISPPPENVYITTRRGSNM